MKISNAAVLAVSCLPFSAAFMGPQLVSRQVTSLNLKSTDGSEHSWLGPVAAAFIGFTGAAQGAVASVNIPVTQEPLVITQEASGSRDVQSQGMSAISGSSVYLSGNSFETLDFSLPSYNDEVKDTDAKPFTPPSFENPFADIKLPGGSSDTADSKEEVKEEANEEEDKAAARAAAAEAKKEAAEAKKAEQEAKKAEQEAAAEKKRAEKEARRQAEIEKQKAAVERANANAKEKEEEAAPPAKPAEVAAPSIFQVDSPPEVKLEIPEFKAPDVKLELPDVKAPDIKLPEFSAPSFSMPKMSMPKIDAPELPKIDAPKVDAPKVDLPSFSMPSAPSFSVPSASSTYESTDEADEIEIEPQEVRDERAKAARTDFKAADDVAAAAEREARELRNAANDKKAVAKQLKDEACATRLGGKWVCVRPLNSGY